MRTTDDGWGEIAEKRRDITRNALVGLVKLAWGLTPQYPDAWDLTPAVLAFLALLEAERGRRDLVTSAFAVRAAGADDGWWKSWVGSLTD